MDPPSLYFREAQGHAANLDDAESKALREATDILGKIEAGVTWKDYKIVSLARLGSDFVSPKNSATYGPFKLIEISRTDGNWEVLVEAQWREKIVLNDKYEIVRTQRID